VELIEKRDHRPLQLLEDDPTGERRVVPATVWIIRVAQRERVTEVTLVGSHPGPWLAIRLHQLTEMVAVDTDIDGDVGGSLVTGRDRLDHVNQISGRPVEQLFALLEASTLQERVDQCHHRLERIPLDCHPSTVRDNRGNVRGREGLTNGWMGPEPRILEAEPVPSPL